MIISFEWEYWQETFQAHMDVLIITDPLLRAMFRFVRLQTSPGTFRNHIRRESLLKSRFEFFVPFLSVEFTRVCASQSLSGVIVIPDEGASDEACWGCNIELLFTLTYIASVIHRNLMSGLRPVVSPKRAALFATYSTFLRTFTRGISCDS